MTFFEFVGMCTVTCVGCIAVLFVVYWFLSRASEGDIDSICERLNRLEEQTRELEKFNKVNTGRKCE